MLDDLNELRTFQQILREGSLSGAGRAMGLSLAVVSKRLTALERRVGVRLINRTTRILSPTEDGVRLLIDVERALEALASGEDRLKGASGEPSGTLRVSAPVSFGRQHIAPILGDLAARYTKLAISLTLSDKLADLVGEGLDVTIRIGEPADSSAVMRKLADNRRILVASPAYLDRMGRPTSADNLPDHMFLRFGNALSTWNLHNSDGRILPFAPRSRLTVDNGDVIHEWALAGHGIMLKSEVDVARDIEAGRLEQVLPEWTGGPAPIIALYPSAQHLPLKTRVFLDAVARQLHAATIRPIDRPGRV